MLHPVTEDHEFVRSDGNVEVGSWVLPHCAWNSSALVLSLLTIDLLLSPDSFFDYFAWRHDYKDSVVSIRVPGGLKSKMVKGW